MSYSEQTLEQLRDAGFAIAYRMLGRVSEAEDVVQEALVRLHQAAETGEVIASPRAYLSTVVTRLAIDTLRSARVRREEYVGEWIPEPLPTGRAADPASDAEMSDSLSMAFLILLENLTPEQRAVFLLREVFDYDYAEIAQIVGRSEAATRQLASRARRHVTARTPRFDATREERDALADQVLAALEEGDLDTLESFLAEDVSVHGDGGGLTPSLPKPVTGRRTVARLLHSWLQTTSRLTRLRIQRVEMNGQPAMVAMDADGRLLSVLVFDVSGGLVRTVRGIVNPEKLAHLGEVGDMNALLRR